MEIQHPLPNEIRELVIKRLLEIEKEHQITILYACESGSRAWGFASPDSDYDVRYVYVPKPEWYMRIDHERNVIDGMIEGDMDYTGWELRKTLDLIRRSTPVVAEWINSPLIYRRSDIETNRIAELAKENYCPMKAHYHYTGLAVKTYQIHLNKESVRYKKYFYALRSLLAARWVERGLGIPPMPFVTLVKTVLEEKEVFHEIEKLLELKSVSTESTAAEPIPIIQSFIVNELIRAGTVRIPDNKSTLEKAIAVNTELSKFLFDTVQSNW